MSSPFDEARYKTLLDGLEVAEVRLSKLERTLRIDSEYFFKEYLEMDARLGNFKTANLSQLVHVSDGNHFAISEKFQEEGIPYYRGQDISHFFIEQAEPVCIDEHTFNHPSLRRSHLHKGDVLLSIVGTIGETALVTTNALATCSCKLAILRAEKIVPEYLAIFLKSKYGKGQIDRLTRGAIQKSFLLEDADQVVVPLLSDKFQEQIKSLVFEGYTKLEESKRLYAAAEETLLSALGLQGWQPPAESTAVKSFAESFGKSGRLDAEYYHPQKDYVMNWLERLNGKAISHYVQSVRDMYNPPLSDTEKAIQNYDLNDALSYFIEDVPAISEYEIGSTKKRIQRDDVLISKLRSYLQEISLVQISKNAEAVGSSEFIVLRSRGKIYPEALMVYLRSKPVQLILKWSQDGSNHPRFQENELLEIKIPDEVIKVQVKIRELIKEGIVCAQESKQLLETARRAVEVAIEQGEAAALAKM